MTISIERFPKSSNRSLKAWSAADELLINHSNENAFKTLSKLIYNDSFGFLTANLMSQNVITVVNFKSQEKAIKNNLTYNKIEFNENQLISPFKTTDAQVQLGLIKVPKSLNLFELYLSQLTQNLDNSGTVLCAFMTRHFSKGMLEIASKYFDSVEQSKAVKKARLLILKGKKELGQEELINSIEFKGEVFKQYYGVFSGKNIDYATQFLIDNIDLSNEPKKVLDLASGNGILAKTIQDKLPNAEIHLIDDSYLAVESSKWNIKGDNAYFIHNNDLSKVNDGHFDYIISNPPFHIEHEIDINLPVSLFQQAYRCLSDNGSFQVVSNIHLNYKTHLQKLFNVVEVTAQNDKFTVLTCRK
jgi:16S rRNA G1207 methylase RsmC